MTENAIVVLATGALAGPFMQRIVAQAAQIALASMWMCG